MKKLTLSLLCAGFMSTVVIADDVCYASFKAGSYSQSEQCYMQQLKNERSANNLYFAGRSLVAQQRYKEALPYLNEAETKSIELIDFVSIYASLGVTYQELGDLEQAYTYFMKQHEISLKLKNNTLISKSYNNLGDNSRLRSQFGKAAEYYEKSLNYSTESEKGTTYINLASFYSDQGEIKKAEEMYLKAIANIEQFGKPEGLGDAKLYLGFLYFQQSRYVEAEKLLNEALVIARKQGLSETEAYALQFLAEIKKVKVK